ncbi:hypothetical protein N7452_004033 [Penicillium brevicompactum]|uniref:Uncharacterized protein n=1 Tax=Penicillium brevicompactum TaxID=5074 RepID=A0A9W9UM61_PENBR|nr:hypothetical protein N7452_004033 [Penicillium brevicompactum]
MDAELKETVIKNFPEDRAAFVKELVTLASGDTGGRGAARTKIDLRRISHTLSMWTLIADPSNDALKCFPQKCENISTLLLEVDFRGSSPYLMKMFNMLAMHIGRLTLRFSDEEEEEVENDARRTELQQLSWKIKDPASDNRHEVIMRALWVRLFTTHDDCICRQCLGAYVPDLTL